MKNAARVCLKPAAGSADAIGGMKRPLTLLLLLSCCAGDAREPDEVRRLFLAFQDALMRADCEALRPLLTPESRRVLAELPLQRARGKQLLEVTGIRGQHSRYVVDVRDPNAGGSPGHFVIVREGGELLVDLVATVTGQNRMVRHGRPDWQLVPGGIDPAVAQRAEAAWRRR